MTIFHLPVRPYSPIDALNRRAAALGSLAAGPNGILVRSHPDNATASRIRVATNAAANLVRAGKLDEAERAAHDLLARFPDVHDGYDRLGMVCEARGDHRQAAEYYRKAIAVIRARSRVIIISALPDIVRSYVSFEAGYPPAWPVSHCAASSPSRHPRLPT